MDAFIQVTLDNGSKVAFNIRYIVSYESVVNSGSILTIRGSTEDEGKNQVFPIQESGTAIRQMINRAQEGN